MRSFLVLVFLLTISVYAYSQPGYMGKKLSIQYNFGAYPAFSNPNYRGNLGVTSFGGIHSGKIDYVITRKSSAGVNYSFSRSSMDHELQVFGSNIYGENHPIKLYNHGLGLYIKKFNSKPGNIAPLGNYVDLELQIINSIVKDELIGQDLEQIYVLGMFLGIGKQNIYFDKIIFDYGFKFGFVPAGLLNPYRIPSAYNSTPRVYFDEEAKVRLLQQSLFCFKVGIGFLAK